LPLNPSVWIICGAGYVSGKEIVSLSLAEGLRNLGWQVNFVTSRWSNGDFPKRLLQAGISNKTLPLGFISKSLNLYALKCTFHQLVFWPILALRYRSLATAHNERLMVHTNWHHILLLLPFLDCKRDIFWLHETIPGAERFAKLFKVIERRTLCIVCVSETVARSVIALGVATERVHVIHNGVKLVGKVPTLGNGSELRFGIIGQVGEWKGHEDVLAAMRRLVDGGQKIELKIFGNGDKDYLYFLKDLALKLGVASMVRWCGYVENQYEIFSAVDVVLAPSRFIEPFGMTAIEAAAHGRPVICTSQGGLLEIVEHENTGFVVEPKNPDMLAQAMGRFLGNRELLTKMGDAARRKVEAEFSLAIFAERFAHLLKKPPAPSLGGPPADVE
jgi:glycosyltransferase involved in cell wall biosynthesis